MAFGSKSITSPGLAAGTDSDKRHSNYRTCNVTQVTMNSDREVSAGFTSSDEVMDGESEISLHPTSEHADEEIQAHGVDFELNPSTPCADVNGDG